MGGGDSALQEGRTQPPGVDCAVPGLWNPVGVSLPPAPEVPGLGLL